MPVPTDLMDVLDLPGPPPADGIWDAMPDAGTPRSLAQLSNVVPLTARLYERAWRFRSLSLLSGRPFPVGEELHELADALGPVAGATVVDIGASEGLYSRHLARLGGRPIAVDHSRPFLHRLRERAAADGLEIVAVRALAQHLPLREGSVDGVCIGGSLNEIGDLPGCVREIARVLRPGGRVFSMSLVRAGTARGAVLQTLVRPTGIVFPSIGATRDLFTAAGLHVESVRVDRVVCRLVGSKP